jgi:hypothetical protein
MFPHTLDHIVAQQHHGPTTPGNLALCCIDCNRHKGPNLAGVDPITGRVRRLFHPRRDNWTKHFKWDGPVPVGLTPKGRATVDVLKINRMNRVANRYALMARGEFFAAGLG